MRQRLASRIISVGPTWHPSTGAALAIEVQEPNGKRHRLVVTAEQVFDKLKFTHTLRRQAGLKFKVRGRWHSLLAELSLRTLQELATEKVEADPDAL